MKKSLIMTSSLFTALALVLTGCFGPKPEVEAKIKQYDIDINELCEVNKDEVVVKNKYGSYKRDRNGHYLCMENRITTQMVDKYIEDREWGKAGFTEASLNTKRLQGWKESGLKPKEAKQWKEHYFVSSAEVIQWKKAGFSSPEEVNKWNPHNAFTRLLNGSHGFSPQEAVAWKKAGFDSKEAIVWKKAFNPQEAAVWKKAGFDSHEAKNWKEISTMKEAIAWKKASFDFLEAENWAKNFTPQEAAAWKKAGFKNEGQYHDEATQWKKAGFSLKEAIVWKRAGFETESSFLGEVIKADTAAKVKKAVGSLKNYRLWKKAGFDNNDILNWTKKGFKTPYAAKKEIKRLIRTNSVIKKGHKYKCEGDFIINVGYRTITLNADLFGTMITEPGEYYLRDMYADYTLYTRGDKQIRLLTKKGIKGKTYNVMVQGDFGLFSGRCSVVK